MPNKTIYVSDDDLELFKKAQEIAGSLSAAIVAALRRYVDVEEGREEGFDEITVRVGPKPGRKQRFVGHKLAEFGRQVKSRVEIFYVYRSRTGKFVVHVDHSPEDSWTRSEGLLGRLGLGDQTWSSAVGAFTLEVVDTLEELKDKVPAELYDIVAAIVAHPVIEDLDI